MTQMKSPGLMHLVATLILTAMGVALVHSLNLDNFAYRYTVVLPGVVAFVMVWLERQDSYPVFWSQFRLHPGVIPWLLVSLLVFGGLAYLSGLITYVIFDGPIPVFRFRMGAGRAGLIVLLALGEELGWRGYALPKLAARHGWPKASLIVGVAWAVWHYPGYLVGFGAPQDIQFLIFAAWVAGASFLFTWVYLKSGGNCWTAVLMHAGANVSLGSLPVMPGAAGGAGTFYVLTGLVVLIAGFLVWAGCLSDRGVPSEG